MRLINTDTGRFEEFIGKSIPKYAILSHTWDAEEISYKEMCSNAIENSKSYQKITMTCQLARNEGLKYVWIDTCCIDKSSSSELTEAINSMYRWYQRAEICYAHLSDLARSGSMEHSLPHCRWFKRGWTLQELIAPQRLVFVNEDWELRGSKEDFVTFLSSITGIDDAILLHKQPLTVVPVARRMSWAAGRETTRIEDTAYCLLGIFNVNMPLLYGEEDKAFRRLQEEIIRTIPDLSIFAWTLPAARNSQEISQGTMVPVYCGVLADSPMAFLSCAQLVNSSKHAARDFSVSNIGIKLNVTIMGQLIPATRTYRYVLPLDCAYNPNTSLGVILRKCGPDQFLRQDPTRLQQYSGGLTPYKQRERYLLTQLPPISNFSRSQRSYEAFNISETRSHILKLDIPYGIQLRDAWPGDRHDNEDQLFFLQGDPEKDALALLLEVRFDADIDGHVEDVRFSCIFYALGWSRLGSRDLQCSLLQYDLQNATLVEAHSQITTWHYDTVNILRILAAYRIPKLLLVAVKIPDTRYCAVVSFSRTVTTDAQLCARKFWNINFSCAVVHEEDLPLISSGEWYPDPKGTAA